METNFFLNILEHIVKFKSYYVVWKPIIPLDIREKLLEFKSYYVVWKQLKNFWQKITGSSLNRTM